MDSIHIHGIGIGCWFIMVVILLSGVRIIGFVRGDSVSSVPLGLEVHCSCVPFFNGSWYFVHGVNSSHERDWDSSRKEVDEHVIIVNFAEGYIALDLRYVISKL